MDLHELFVAFYQAGAKRGEVTIGVDPGAGDDRAVYRCSCGYLTELLEVLAIHAVRAHNFPEGPLLFNPPRMVDVVIPPGRQFGRGRLVITDWYHADEPDGPWTLAIHGQPLKRYLQRRDRQL